MIDFFEKDMLGRMDPLACGIWLNIDSILDSKNNKLSSLSMHSFINGNSVQQVKYYKGCSNNEQKNSALHRFSLFSHEARHYHDLMLTPYGSMLKRQFTSAKFNYLLWQKKTILRKPKAIYVPLRKWITNADMLKDIFPELDLPSMYSISLSKQLNTIYQKVELFKKGVYNTALGLNANDILEGLAILTQETKIMLDFGDEARAIFRKNMLTREAGRRYYAAPEFICYVFGGMLPVDVMMYLMLAALSGNYQDQTTRPRYPSDLLQSILDWMIKNGYTVDTLQSFESIVVAIDSYFADVHDSTLIDQIAQATIANIEMEICWENYLKNINIGHHQEDFNLVLAEFKQFQLIQMLMSQKFTVDAISYCSPLSYIPTQYVLPPPMIFAESSKGVLIPNYESMFYMHNESEFQNSESVLKAIRDSSYKTDNFNIHSVHIAYEMSLNPPQKTKGDKLYQHGVEYIKLTQKLYDIFANMRLLIDGPIRLSKPSVEMAVASFHILGIKVYSELSELAPKAFIDPEFLREEFSNLGVESSVVENLILKTPKFINVSL